MVAIYAKAFKDAAKANDNSAKFKSSAIFKKIEETLKADGETLVNKVKGIFAFKVKVNIIFISLDMFDSVPVCYRVTHK